MGSGLGRGIRKASADMTALWLKANGATVHSHGLADLRRKPDRRHLVWWDTLPFVIAGHANIEVHGPGAAAGGAHRVGGNANRTVWFWLRHRRRGDCVVCVRNVLQPFATALCALL